MKSLVESIKESTSNSINPNKEHYFEQIKAILKGGDYKDVKKLQELWDSAELGVRGLYWKYWFFNPQGYIYCTTDDNLVVINTHDKFDGWDMEITRDTFRKNDSKSIREKLIEKLEKSGHFVIDKNPKASEHWLAKII